LVVLSADISVAGDARRSGGRSACGKTGAFRLRTAARAACPWRRVTRRRSRCARC